MVDYIGGIATKNKPFAYRATYDGDNYNIYQGWASPGTTESTASWQIVKNFWSNGNLTKTSFADGSGEFSKQWSLKDTAYTYL